MKKILLAFLLILGACSQNNPDKIKPGSYKMLNSMYDVPTILLFSEDGSLSGKVVNVIMGKYELNGNNIIINPTGTTMMMGSEKEMDAEQNFIKALMLVKTFKMHENRLSLILENGTELIFEPYTEPKE